MEAEKIEKSLKKLLISKPKLNFAENRPERTFFSIFEFGEILGSLQKDMSFNVLDYTVSNGNYVNKVTFII
jgi:hypothetical protein